MLRAALRHYRTAYAGLPREAWLLALALFVNRAGTMVLPFLTLYLTTRIGLSEAAAGRMISVYGVGALCGAYVSGRLCDVVGPVRLQMICMFVAAPGYLLVSLGRSWPTIALALFGLSLASEAVRPANATAITRVTTGANRARAFALQRLALNLGFSIGPAAGGLLATIDFRWLFYVDAATTLAAGVLLLVTFGWRRAHLPPRHADPTAPRVSPLRDGPFVAFLGLTLLTMMAFLQFSSTYPLYLYDHFGLTKPMIGLMFVVNTALIVAVEMPLIQAAKGWPLLRTIGWGSGVACLGFGMLPFGSSAAYAVLAMVVVTVGEMLSFPLAAAYVAGRSRPGAESHYMSWFVATHSAAWILGPALGAALYQANPAATWWACLAVAGVVVVGYHRLAARVGDGPCETLESVNVAVTSVAPPADLPLEQLPTPAESTR